MARFPNWLVGKRLDAASLAQMVPDIYLKNATNTITSLTTLANDNELANIALAIGTYEVDLLMYATGAAAGNLKVAWAFTGTVSSGGLRACVGPGTSSSAIPSQLVQVDSSAIQYNTAQTYGMGSTGTYSVIRETCTRIVISVAGSLSIQVAQATSSATSTVIQPDSCVKVRQIA